MSNLSDFVIVITGIIASIGGGGGIILAFSNYLGQVLAKQYEEKIKTRFQNEINEYQNQLDIIKQTTIRYSDKQFELYSKLWSTLYDLKILADNLWEEASSQRLIKFSKQLKLTKKEIEKASLFIEENHYNELIKIINFFAEYQLGKEELIDYRITNHFDSLGVERMITENREKKIAFEELISAVKMDLKRQIGGR